MLSTSRFTRFLGLVILLSLWSIAALAESAAQRPATPKKHDIPRVKWAEDVSWQAIKDRAQAAGDHPILIDFYAQWCGPCKLLDAMVYNEKKVIDELSDVVTFKVDIDKPEYADIKEHFSITSLPTLVWCDARGREVDRFVGYVSSVEFMEHVAVFRSGETSLLTLNDQVAQTPEDAGSLLVLAQRYQERGDLQRADILYRRLVNLQHGADPGVLTDGILALAEMEIDADRSPSARGLITRAAGLIDPTHPEARPSLLRTAEYQAALGDTANVLATYQTLLDIDGRDIEALNGYAHMAALSGLDLTEASRMALKAVLFSDEEPHTMNTLAECYFQRGLYHKAIRWSRKCVTKEPESELYRRQLARFEDALKQDPWSLRAGR